ncbi:DUF4241 domain-containing protein [Tenacibaculum agarivorans]|uniref:DUF4241 domain-containing protein n=1 Tax=Tenacibaculum agarivorans TaxID=1908389 RepID=UPI00094BA459|nr:DUF4241 domain-containing protein [Tenacibaculum agarivorans]
MKILLIISVSLVIFIILSACGNKKSATKNIKEEATLFTIDEIGTKVNTKYPLFEKLKTDKDFSQKNEKYKTELLELGNLNITSGELVLCDIREHKDPPNKFYPDSNPFVIQLKHGAYNINVIIANTIDHGDRTAFVELNITNHKATQWILAHKTSHNLYNLERGSLYGTNTEAATLTLFDRKSGIIFYEKRSDYLKENTEKSEFDFFEYIFKYSEYDLKNYTKSSCINVDLGEKNNLIQFCTGYGDGSYPAYWGIDKDNYICALVIDFGVLDNI